MKRHTMLTTAAGIASVFLAAPALAQLPTDPTVLLGLANVRPDGTISGAASQIAKAAGQNLDGVLLLSPCDSMSASSYSRIPAAATHAWRVAGTVLSISAETASADISWEPASAETQAATGPRRSRTVSLRLKEPVRLEEISIEAAGSCPARHVVLQIELAQLPRFSGVAGGGGVGVSAVPGAREGSAPSGRGGGGGGFVTRDGGQTFYPAPRASSASTPRPRRSVDLWLVHNAPGQTSKTYLQQSEISIVPRAINFDELKISVPAGVFTVNVECFIEEGLSPEGAPRLFVSATRKVSYTPSSGVARDVRPVHEGSIKTAVPVPGPTDVVAFELPSIVVPGAPTAPDQLSIRLRWTPTTAK